MSTLMQKDSELIWKEFHARLRRFIQSRVRDENSTDDILQEVFLRIHARIDTLRDDSKLESWIYQIARNAIIDHYRTHKSTDATVELVASIPAEVESDEADAARQLAPGLVSMVECLPPEYREAVTLTEFGGLTQKELAEKLGMSVSGAKSRVQRAREKLKAMLLECCHFELDRRGKIIDYYPRPNCCAQCACNNDSGRLMPT